MFIRLPLSVNTDFYLKEAGYVTPYKQTSRDTHILLDYETKRFAYQEADTEFKLHPRYIPKVLTDTSLLDQIPLLVALGLSEKEIIEILRS